MRIVIDSNVLFSAILYPKSRLAEVCEYVQRHHTLVIPSAVKEEIYDVFHRKQVNKLQALDKFFAEAEYEWFQTPKCWQNTKLPYIRDPQDEPILASAILADAAILITGDKDFLEVSCANLQIMTPSDFMMMTQNQSPQR